MQGGCSIFLAIWGLGGGGDRSGHMFDQYVSTSSTTSTISTSSICFVTSDTAPTVCKRRRRGVVVDAPLDHREGEVEGIHPSRIER